MGDRSTAGESVIGQFDTSVSPKGLMSGDHRKPTIIILLSSLIITTWKYYGSQDFYLSELQRFFVIANDPGLTAEIYVFGTAFLLMGLIPLAVIKFIFKESLREYGIQLGDWRFGLKAFAVIAPIMVLSTIPSASMPDFMKEYPIYKDAGATGVTFLNHTFRYLVFYIGWEIMFRGFMQFGLRSLGDWNAILIQTALSGIAHIGKPSGEIYSSFLGALIWGVVVFRSKSLLYVILIHWVLGVSLDWFISFGW